MFEDLIYYGARSPNNRTRIRRRRATKIAGRSVERLKQCGVSVATATRKSTLSEVIAFEHVNAVIWSGKYYVDIVANATVMRQKKIDRLKARLEKNARAKTRLARTL